MDPIKQFEKEREERIADYSKGEEFKKISSDWTEESFRRKYVYNFEWLGRPIIQYPQDMIAMQEIIWKIKPDLIIETGIAHGGSIIYYASLLELIGKGEVLGIDIDIRSHNKTAIENHPMYKRIKMIQGSSISSEVFNKVREISKDMKTILVCLDAYHTHEHVLKELEMYSELVTKNSYLVVFDTFVEYLPDELFLDRPWKKGNNPKTAVSEFLKNNKNFMIDTSIPLKLLITSAPDGYLKCIK